MAEPDILSITKPIKLIYTKEINGLWYANLDIEKNDYIQEECYVEFDGILFIAKKINEIKDKKGRLISRIKLDHLMSELNDFGIAPFEYNGITCIAALASVLSETTWSAGTSDIEGTGNIKSDKRITVLAAINLIAKEFDGELDFICNKVNSTFTRVVDLKQQIGTATKLQIRYDKNSDYMEREKDPTRLITRLYVYGKDDITIESVNPTGKPYLDSANIGKYQNIKEYPLYTNISDKTVLMNYGQAYLDLYDTSLLRYKINTWDASIIPKWADEVINLGDTLRVYDTDLNSNTDERVKKLTKDLTDPRYQITELANKFKTISEPISNLEQAIKNITFSNDYRALDIRDVTFPRDIPTGLPHTWTIYIGGKLEVGYYQGPVVHVDRAGTAYEIWCYVAWKPTAGDATIRMNRNGISIGEVTIPQGEYVAPGEGEVGAGAAISINVALSYGDYLNVDILEADDVAQRLTAQVRCR